MLKFFRNRLDKKGFTLVELLVVIAVLGIIAGIAIPRMTGVTDSFRQNADRQTAQNLARVVQVRVQSGIQTVPTTGSVMITLTNGNSGFLGENFTDRPQFNTGFTNTNRMYLVGIDANNIYIYNAPNGTAALPANLTVPGDQFILLQNEAHGGRIQ